MKNMLLILLINVLIVCAGSCILSANEEATGEQFSAELQKDTEDVERGFIDPDKTKVEKVSDTISTIPETTGNIFLDGFNKIGNWLEEKSGNRFETKWNPQRTGNSSLYPEQYGLDRDPAKGS